MQALASLVVFSGCGLDELVRSLTRRRRAELEKDGDTCDDASQKECISSLAIAPSVKLDEYPEIDPLPDQTSNTPNVILVPDSPRTEPGPPT